MPRPTEPTENLVAPSMDSEPAADAGGSSSPVVGQAGGLLLEPSHRHAGLETLVECIDEGLVLVGLDGIALLSITDVTERRRAEDALRESEARFREVVESAPAAIFIQTEGRFGYLNPAALRLFGSRDSGELLGQPVVDWFHPDFRDVVSKRIQQLNEQRVAVPMVVERILRCDGTAVDVEVAAVPFIYHGLEGALVFAHDITDRKRAEDALRASEQRFRTVIETSPDAVALLAVDGQVLLANQQAAAVFGFDDVAQLLAVENGFALLASEDRARARADTAQLLEKGVQRDRAYDGLRRDGSRVPLEISASLEHDRDGQPKGMILVFRDVSQRKQAEQRQQRLLNRLQALNSLQKDLLLPGSPSGKFAKIADTAVTLLDLDFCRIWRVGSGDLCQRGCVHANVNGERSACSRRDGCLHLMASSGRYTHLDGNHRRVPFGYYKIGRIYRGEEQELLTNQLATDPNLADPAWARDLGLVAFAGYKLVDGQGRPLGVLAGFARHPISPEDDAILSNLAETTSRVILDAQAENELREKRREAVAASRAKSEFLANMSHEIRTPMTAILGFTELLMTPDLAPGEQQEFLDGIHRNGKALLELINGILDLSRIEADKLTLEKKPCALRQILDDVLLMMRPPAAEKGLRLEADYAAEVPETIHTDGPRLRQILTNLVGNAVKFTACGGVQIDVRGVPGTGRIQFAVRDTGIGIPPDKIPELFQPFTQVDGSATRRYGGAGLGLAISRRLAEALGGDITVSSRLGAGTTFVLSIDAGLCVAAPTAAVTPWANEPRPSRAKDRPRFQGRVLLAEDVPGLQMMISRLLGRLNLQVEIADDGQMACAMVEKSQAEGTPFDLILMDIQMPVMNGLQATQWLRDHEWKGPIVALTAHAMVGDRERYLNAGCDDYLSKPIQNEQLHEVLGRYLVRCPAPVAGGPA
jgi:PAS domain S-box-containing protein